VPNNYLKRKVFMANDSKFAKNPHMMFVISFFVVTVVNAIILGVANAIVPMQVVVGTFTIPPLFALLLTGASLSLITLLVLPFLTEVELRRGKNLSPAEMMAAYLVVNFVGLWLLTRRSEIFGVGVSSWMVVLVLAAVLDFVQGMVMMGIEQWSKK
jgi:hypothetical protein